MFVISDYPESWQNRTQTKQFYTLQKFAGIQPQRITFDSFQLDEAPIEEWALIRVVSGELELKVESERILVLEPGDCWLAYAGSLYRWYQPAEVELDVWLWADHVAATNPQLVYEYSDLLLELLRFKQKAESIDPLPGFEFFKLGEEIIHQGDIADSVYTIIEGTAKVVIDGKTVGEAKENEILGLQAMLLKRNRTASVVANGHCCAVKVTYDKFLSLIKSRPELVMSTLETMALQIERANQRLTRK